MLSRYKIRRGKRPEGDPLPEGVRQDTRKHTRHCLRPEARSVESYLANPVAERWEKFQRAYLYELEKRFEADRTPFDGLAKLARERDVYLGCNCPTERNPDPRHCHTIPALAFMKQKYPDLKVVFPPSVAEPPVF